MLRSDQCRFPQRRRLFLLECYRDLGSSAGSLGHDVDFFVAGGFLKRMLVHIADLDFVFRQSATAPTVGGGLVKFNDILWFVEDINTTIPTVFPFLTD